jgi:hypothetical protein
MYRKHLDLDVPLSLKLKWTGGKTLSDEILGSTFCIDVTGKGR